MGRGVALATLYPLLAIAPLAIFAALLAPLGWGLLQFQALTWERGPLAAERALSIGGFPLRLWGARAGGAGTARGPATGGSSSGVGGRGSVTASAGSCCRQTVIIPELIDR